MAQKKPGRPEHKPDFNTRRLVKALAFEGVPQYRIAVHLGVDEKTLVKWYRSELDTSTELMCAMVAQNMARIATRPSGGQASVNAGKFILSCRGGWKDTSRIEVASVGRGITGLLEIIRNAPPLDLDDLGELESYQTHEPDPAPRPRH